MMFVIVFFETSAKENANINEIFVSIGLYSTFSAFVLSFFFVSLANELPDMDRSYSGSSAGGTVFKVHVPEKRKVCC
jgi:hypothetical protein